MRYGAMQLSSGRRRLPDRLDPPDSIRLHADGKTSFHHARRSSRQAEFARANAGRIAACRGGIARFPRTGKSNDAIFPTLLGVKLSNRLKSETLETIMSEIRKASAMGEARARARASELADKLKGDNFKRYEITLEGSPQQ